MKYETVALVKLNFEAFPRFRIETAHGSDYRVTVGQQVRVALPEIVIDGTTMPQINIDLQVRRSEDARTLRLFLNEIANNMVYYKDFWNRRKTELKTGIFLP